MRQKIVFILIITYLLSSASLALPSNFVKGEVLIKLKTDTVPTSINKLNQKFKLKKMEKVFRPRPHQKKKPLPDLSRIYKLKFPLDKDVLKMVNEYRQDPNVEYAEPNYRFMVFAPNDPYYADYPSDPNQWHLFKVKLHQTGSGTSGWNITTGESSVAIAVIDTGVDWDHPDLDTNVWTNSGDTWSNPASPETGDATDNDSNGFTDDFKGWDFTDIVTDEYTAEGFTLDPNEDYTDRDNDPMDYHGHGTHCSGIASAATNNSTGIAGAGWNSRIMCLRSGFRIYHPSVGWTGMLENDDCAAALQYAADMGAKVVSMSWGGDYSSTIRNAVDYAYANDCVLIAAAGNENHSTPSYPAAYPNVMAVAATGVSDTKASYSNYGSWVDVSAPGGDGAGTGRILSTYYDDAYAWARGTSMATPLVAGVAGLARSRSPALTNEAITDQLKDTADPIDDLNPTYAGQLGTGRINAARCLDSEGPVINVSSPPAGEKIKGGTSRNISWSTTIEGFAISPESISIYYSTDSGATFPNTIASDIPNSGSHSWDIPRIDSGSVRIKVTGRDLIENLSFGLNSGNFTVDSSPPDINIASPAASEQIRGGSTKNITWVMSDEGSGVSPESVSIHYSTDGGANFPNAIAGNINNSGAYLWDVPTLDASSVRLKISAADTVGNSSFEVSSLFAIDSTSPPAPSIDPITSPTNLTAQTLTGSRSADTAIVTINGTSAGVTYTSATSWSYNASLSAGGNTFTVRGQDAAGNESGGTTISITVQELTFSDAATGMTITFPVNSTTVVPTLAVSVYDGAQELSPYPTARALAGSALNITSNVTQFIYPVTITIDFPAGTLHPQPYFWDTAANAWSNSGINVISRTNSSITFTATHFSVFAVFGVSGLLSDILVYPNPYCLRSPSGVIFNGLTGDEWIRIYTMAGELVASCRMQGTASWSWDAANSFGNRVSRGVYLYVITNNLGQKRLGKIAVQE